MCNEKEINDAMAEVCQTLSESQEPLPADFQQVLDDNRWDLMVKEEGHGQIP